MGPFFDSLILRWRQLLTLMVLMAPARSDANVEFALGLLSNQSSTSISQGSGQSVYTGQGSGIDARILLGNNSERLRLGINVFYQFIQSSGVNKESTNERIKLGTSVFGLDFTRGWYFFGGKVSTSYGAIQSAQQNYSVNFDHSGLRGGFKIHLSSKLRLNIGGFSTSGTILASKNPDVGSDRTAEANGAFVELSWGITD